MIGLLMLATVQTAAGKAFWNGNELLAACEASDSGPKIDCLGYVSGASDMLSAMQSVGGGKRTACLPEHVSRQQAADVVVGYLKRHPEVRQYLAGSLVRLALADSFPCGR